jgi:hypothetical protein
MFADRPPYHDGEAAAGVGALNHVLGLGTSDSVPWMLTLPGWAKARIVNSVANRNRLRSDMIGILPGAGTAPKFKGTGVAVIMGGFSRRDYGIS